MNLPTQKALPQEDGCSSLWSHMSDYDGMGLPPNKAEGVEQDVKSGDVEARHMMITYYQTQAESTESDDAANNVTDGWGHYNLPTTTTIHDHEQKCDQQVWCPEGQIHQANGRRKSGTYMRSLPSGTHMSLVGVEQIIGCMISMSKKQRQRRIAEDSDDDEEGSDMICNMIGYLLGSLPFPIIIEPGVCASVMPTNWCNHLSLQETAQSKAGEHYRAANGNKIYHEGGRVVSMTTQEGAMRDFVSLYAMSPRPLGQFPRCAGQSTGLYSTHLGVVKGRILNMSLLVKDYGCKKREVYTNYQPR